MTDTDKTECLVSIGGRKIGEHCPVYIVAEISANHNQSIKRALQIILEAHAAGADAVKLQTYTPDTITLKSEADCFIIKDGPWAGRTLYDLYGQAFTPWAWHEELLGYAREIGIDCFSSPFDISAVDFLETLDVPAYKIASPEIVDLPLLRYVAATGKPVIMSTGMATLLEIEEAVSALRSAGAEQIILTKCTSAYPAPPETMNLRTIPTMNDHFGMPVGLSDHTMGIAVSVASVSLGACMIEKHICLSRSEEGPDSAFSMEPAEFKTMVETVRIAEAALGSSSCEPSADEELSRKYRRSLFVVQDVKKGELLTADNVRSIRPADGLHPRHYEEVLGRVAIRKIKKGTPLLLDMVEQSNVIR